MQDLSVFKGWHFMRFGFRPGFLASLHLVRFSSTTREGSPRRLANLTFVRASKITLQSVSYEDAAIQAVKSIEKDGKVLFCLTLSVGAIEIEAEDVVSIVY